jgi:hypothetical protein
MLTHADVCWRMLAYKGIEVPLQPLTIQRRRSMSSWIAISRSRCSCIRQHTSAYVSGGALCRPESLSVARSAAAYISIHLQLRFQLLFFCAEAQDHTHTSAYVSIRQHTSADAAATYMFYVFSRRFPHPCRHQYQLAYMLVWGHLRWRMLTYADVCWRMQLPVSARIYASMRTHIY